MIAVDESDRTSKATYQTLLGVLEHNTGGPQPEAMRLSSLLITQASHGPDDPEDVRTALKAAIQNDDVLTYTDRDGRVRVCPADAPESKLREIIEFEGEKGDPAKSVIGRAYRMLKARGDL